ncbi:MAG: septum formation family protein [Micropruina sp.]|nr:MAG: septum formation family protein [Micropruina sp.]
MRPLLSMMALSALLAVTGCSSDAPRNSAGAVTASASVDAFSIKVGDCTGKLTTGTIEGTDLVPCDEKHYYEVFGSTQMTGDTFPGESETSKQAQKFCDAEFTKFVGIPSTKSKYGVFYLTPIADSWKAGDREILCLVGDDNGGIKGTLKGAKK